MISLGFCRFAGSKGGGTVHFAGGGTRSIPCAGCSLRTSWGAIRRRPGYPGFQFFQQKMLFFLFKLVFPRCLKSVFMPRQATWKTWKTWTVFCFGALGMADATGSTPVVRRSGRSSVVIL